MEAKQTPLIDLLERVPQDARLVVEHDQFSSSSHPVGRLCHEAITALRAALAQPDDWTRCHHCGQTMPPVPLAQAEPVQEPVAWQCSVCGGGPLLCLHNQTDVPLYAEPAYRALYTAPPRRTMVPLTDEEAAKACGAGGNLGPLMQIVHAVEKASWEKNNG